MGQLRVKNTRFLLLSLAAEQFYNAREVGIRVPGSIKQRINGCSLRTKWGRSI